MLDMKHRCADTSTPLVIAAERSCTQSRKTGCSVLSAATKPRILHSAGMVDGAYTGATKRASHDVYEAFEVLQGLKRS